MTTEQILENIDLKLVETTVEGAYVRVYFHSKRKSRSYTYNVLLDNELFDYLKNFRDGINNEGMFNYEGAKDYTADDNPNAKHCAYVHATLIWHYMQP